MENVGRLGGGAELEFWSVTARAPGGTCRAISDKRDANPSNNYPSSPNGFLFLINVLTQIAGATRLLGGVLGLKNKAESTLWDDNKFTITVHPIVL